MSGAHLSTKKAFYRGRDRTMGHSSVLTYMNQHHGTKFPGAERIFEQSPTNVKLRKIDIPFPNSTVFHEVKIPEKLPFIDMKR